MRYSPVVSLLQADKSWATIIFDPDAEEPLFVGLHILKKVNLGDSGWIIYKFIRIQNKLVRIERAEGSFNDRDILFS